MGIVQRRSIEIKQVLRDLQTVDTWKCCILHGKLRQTPTDQLQAIPIATQPAAEVSAHTVAGSEPRGVTRYAPIERDLPQELVGERRSRSTPKQPQAAQNKQQEPGNQHLNFCNHRQACLHIATN